VVEHTASKADKTLRHGHDLTTRGKLTARQDREKVILVQEIHKYYELGETRVHALRGVGVRNRAWGICHHHGLKRQRQVDIYEYSGLPRQTQRRTLPARRRRGFQPQQERTGDNPQPQNRVCFQGFNLLARTTALENVELPTLYARISKAEGEKRSREALALVGLENRVAHFPRSCPAVSSSA